MSRSLAGEGDIHRQFNLARDVRGRSRFRRVDLYLKKGDVVADALLAADQVRRHNIARRGHAPPGGSALSATNELGADDHRMCHRIAAQDSECMLGFATLAG